MIHAADPQTQSAGSRLMLSPDDYHRPKSTLFSGSYPPASRHHLTQQAVTASALYLFLRRMIPVNNPRLQHGSCTDGDKQQHGRDAAEHLAR